jgi:transposase InsO family protein
VAQREVQRSPPEGTRKGVEAGIGIGKWFRFYNERRPHRALSNQTPVAARAAR